jgi:hypothetical protein
MINILELSDTRKQSFIEKVKSIGNGIISKKAN